MTSPSEVFTGRKTVHVLKDTQRLDELDLWPGDAVMDSQFNPLGKVNVDGVFVMFASDGKS